MEDSKNKVVKAGEVKSRRKFLKTGAAVAAGGTAAVAMPNIAMAQVAVLKVQAGYLS